MFMFHVALALSLIALTAGSALYVFSSRCDGKGTCFANVIAILVILLSIASSICTLYCGFKAWVGAEQCPMCMMHGMQTQDKSMMGDQKSMNMMQNKN